MAEPIRLLHFADLHIGVENYGKLDNATGISTRVLDFLRRMEDVSAHAEAHQADLILCAGDIFHSRRPTPTYQREFARRLRRMAALCPVVLLVGNHDQPTMLKKATTIEIYNTLDVPNVIVGKRYGVQTIQTRRGPVQVAMVPYPDKGRLLQDETTAGLSIAEIDRKLQNQVRLTIEQMARQVAENPAPRVLTAHLTVNGAQFGSERGIMAGRDASVSLSTLNNPVWDYVALGHIHKHQHLTLGQPGAPPVVYAGSLERIDFGEEKDDKGFCWVELARGATDWHFVGVEARSFKTLHIDARKHSDPTAEVVAALEKHDLTAKVLRLIIQADPVNSALLSERDIRTAADAAGVYHLASIHKQVERPTRTKWGDVSPESMTPLELLERYLISKAIDTPRREALLQYAERLIAGEN